MSHEIPNERVVLDAGRALHTRADIDTEGPDAPDDIGNGFRHEATGNEKTPRQVTSDGLDR
jgi:hypothetical protein